MSDTDQTQVDARLVFLLRAAARFDLFEAGEMTIDEAFDDLLPALDAIEWNYQSTDNLTDTGTAA